MRPILVHFVWLISDWPFATSPVFPSHLRETPLGTRCRWANRRNYRHAPFLFTVVVHIPHRAAKPEHSRGGKEGFSDGRLTSSGSRGRKQHSEEETSQRITSGCCFSLCCGVFFCGWLAFMSYLAT